MENVVKSFGKGDIVTRALDGVTFTVSKGAFVAIMGPSGSGKTTLLNVVSTIEPIDGGKIVVDGVSISTLKDKSLAEFRRDKLGFIFQEYNLLDTLTVEENIALPLNLKKTGAAETKEKVLRVSEILGVTDQLDKFPTALSGGQRQRLRASGCNFAGAHSRRRTDGCARFAQFESAYGSVIPHEQRARFEYTHGNA